MLPHERLAKATLELETVYKELVSLAPAEDLRTMMKELGNHANAVRSTHGLSVSYRGTATPEGNTIAFLRDLLDKLDLALSDSRACCGQLQEQLTNIRSVVGTAPVVLAPVVVEELPAAVADDLE